MWRTGLLPSLPVLMNFVLTIIGFLESVTSTSFWTCSEFGTSVTRGNLGDWYILQWSSSPVFMHTKSQIAVCLKELLHAIEFDRIAIPFSKQALNCANTLYWYKLSNCACTVRFWVCPDRIRLLADLVEYPSGSRRWRTLTVCPSWFFFLLGSVHFF